MTDFDSFHSDANVGDDNQCNIEDHDINDNENYTRPKPMILPPKNSAVLNRYIFNTKNLVKKNSDL
jgi:hypothetical protein